MIGYRNKSGIFSCMHIYVLKVTNLVKGTEADIE